VCWVKLGEWALGTLGVLLPRARIQVNADAVPVPTFTTPIHVTAVTLAAAAVVIYTCPTLH
jgi:hypothetical protein